MSLGLVGIESYEFVVANLERSRQFYLQRMDFREVARSGRALVEKTGEESSILRAGKNVEVRLSTPVSPKSRAAKYLAWHPEGVAELTFQVKDLDRAWSFLQERRATFVHDPVEVKEGDRSYRHFAIVSALGDVVFRYVERKNWDGVPPGFDALPVSDAGNRFQFAAVDHVTVNMLTLEPWIRWCRETLGMEQFWEIQFHTEDVRKSLDGGSGLKSIVMRDAESNVRFACNEPMKPYFGESQITKFVEDHRGAGVQHIAFIVPEIIPTVEGLRERGLPFMKTGPSYYAALPERFQKVGLTMSTIKEPMDVLSRNGILIDGANERYMLQIFVAEQGQIFQDEKGGPFFYEIIQRCGDRGFGGGNFRALFESIENDQKARGK